MEQRTPRTIDDLLMDTEEAAPVPGAADILRAHAARLKREAHNWSQDAEECEAAAAKAVERAAKCRKRAADLWAAANQLLATIVTESTL